MQVQHKQKAQLQEQPCLITHGRQRCVTEPGQSRWESIKAAAEAVQRGRLKAQ